MTHDELEREANELHAKYPRLGPGTISQWSWLAEASREYWREKVRNGERAAAQPERVPPTEASGARKRKSV